MAPPLPQGIRTSSSSIDDPDAPVMSAHAVRIKELKKKRYHHPQKMSPRIGITAMYVLSLHHIIANVRPRAICSTDWCALYPDGTIGKFNFYWDNIDKDLLKVCLTHFILYDLTLTLVTYISRSTRKRRRPERPK